jgi:hypothetical protein
MWPVAFGHVDVAVTVIDVLAGWGDATDGVRLTAVQVGLLMSYGMLAAWSKVVVVLEVSLTQTPKRSCPAGAPVLFQLHVALVEYVRCRYQVPVPAHMAQNSYS